MFFWLSCFSVQTNSWLKSGKVHRCTRDLVLARGLLKCFLRRLSLGKRDDQIGTFPLATSARLKNLDVNMFLETRNDVALTCFCQKNPQSSIQGSHGNPGVHLGRAGTQQTWCWAEKSHCCVSAVWYYLKPTFLQLNASSTAVITVFGDNTNARPGAFAYIIDSLGWKFKTLWEHRQE